MNLGEKSGERRSWVRYGVDVLPSVLVVAAAVVVMYSNLSQAQKDIAEIKADEIRHEEMLKDIPAMAADIENIEGALQTISTAIVDINKTLKADAIEDAKAHHTH